jgi:hypothetical protein
MNSLTIEVLNIIVGLGGGFVLSIIASYYNVTLPLTGKIRRYQGTATDFRVVNAEEPLEVGEGFSAVDLGGDFARSKRQLYSVDDCKIKFLPKGATLFAKIGISSAAVGLDKSYFVARGRGTYITGDSNNGMLIFVVRAKHPNVSWNVVYLLRYAQPGRLQGYWISDDTLNSGRFTIGQISLDQSERV